MSKANGSSCVGGEKGDSEQKVNIMEEYSHKRMDEHINSVLSYLDVYTSFLQVVGKQLLDNHSKL